MRIVEEIAITVDDLRVVAGKPELLVGAGADVDIRTGLSSNEFSVQRQLALLKNQNDLDLASRRGIPWLQRTQQQRDGRAAIRDFAPSEQEGVRFWLCSSSDVLECDLGLVAGDRIITLDVDGAALVQLVELTREGERTIGVELPYRHDIVGPRNVRAEVRGQRVTMRVIGGRFLGAYLRVVRSVAAVSIAVPRAS